LNHDEEISIDNQELTNIIKRIAQKHINLLPKATQQLGAQTIANNTISYMEDIGFLIDEEENLKILPILGKITGAYEKELKT
ncbi:MAG TPA: hypothetical protein VFC75_02305, partial [Erysipelothrix sp.]|nr:hypothetical protein [Erysipelothrix sp.]